MASVQPAAGLIAVQGQLTRNSFLLSHDCHPTGGFAFYAWFGGPHEGDFVVTLGGYHPKFPAPAHYPKVPRLAMQWRLSSALQIKGTSYFALVPNAVMMGGTLEALWDCGPVRAWFRAAYDFLVYWKPFAYQVSISISVGAQVTIDLLFTSVTISVHVGAELTLHGPPFGGEAWIDLDVVSFTIPFGSSTPDRTPLTWAQFKTAFLPQVLSLPPGTALPWSGPGATNTICLARPAAGLMCDLTRQKNYSGPLQWVVNGERLALEVACVIPAKSASFNAAPLVAGASWSAAVGVAPAATPASAFQSDLAIALTRTRLRPGETAVVVDMIVTPVLRNVPAALWLGEAPGNADKPRALAMPSLGGEALVPDALVGVRIVPARIESHRTADIPIEALRYTQDVPLAFDWSRRPDKARDGWQCRGDGRSLPPWPVRPAGLAGTCAPPVPSATELHPGGTDRMNTTVAPQAVGTVLSFVEHHHPPMPPGEYELSITQHVGLPGVQDSFLHKAAFAVGGERFALDPAEIDSVFPPQSAQGEFFNVLPHVVITRRTLPWERSLADSASPPSGLTPWLALLVFDQGEAVTGPKAMTVLDLVGADVHPGGRLPAGTVSYDGLGRLDPGESYDDPCQVVDLDLTLFQSLAPTRKDLAWLAHGRVASTARKAGPLGTSAASVQDYAIVVASRLPRMGSRSLACLVSLEGLDAWLPGPGARSPGPAGRIRLVCLTSWAFHTLAEPETFNECLTALDRAALRPDARSAGVPSDDGDAYLGAVANLGYLPLSHQLRDGGTAVSWYRGPLAPLATPRTVTVPVDSADAALRQDPATGMLDVSYATAWQIGRLLALQDRVFSTALYRWKTATRRETVAQAERELLGRRLGQAVAAGDLRTVAAASLGGRLGAALEKPAATTSPAPLQPAASSPTAPPPAMVSEWLARLRLLKGVPFPHLVPDEAMLPPESVRFFQLDFNWNRLPRRRSLQPRPLHDRGPRAR